MESMESRSCISSAVDNILNEKVPTPPISQIYLWNEHLPHQVNRCVHEIIQERCQVQPTATAVCAWDGDFTYAELDNLSSALAAHLQGFGVGPEVFVPLCFEKSRWTTVAMLAVMKAGGAFVLLDSSHPQARLQRICEDVSARLIVASTQNASLAVDLAPRVVEVGNFETTWNRTNNQLKLSSVDSKHALYAVFTSGSTGTPKGVVIGHDSFYACMLPYSRALHLNHDSRIFLFASYAFDVCIFDTLTALAMGGCVCVPSETDRWSDIAKAIRHFKISHASFTPTVARILDPAELPSLKTLVLGGEMLPSTDLVKWTDRVQVINLYGATECPLISMTESKVGRDLEPCSISHPTGSICWIVDEDDHERLLPPGEIGELLIEGPTIGRGYLNNPEKTAATFIKPPTWLLQFRGSDSGARVYKTGDLAQCSPDGSIRNMGRKDTQVKLRGQRIELGEVEHHVRQCFQSVRDVVVELVTPTESGRPPMLMAFICNGSQSEDQSSYLVTDPGNIFAAPTEQFLSEISTAESRLQQSVPAYMVPAIFVALVIIPLTKTGKTDRRQLRERAAALSREDLEIYRGLKKEKRAPVTATERTLQQLWAQVLNLPPHKVGTDDSFLSLGGDSVSAMQVASWARIKDIKISAQDILTRKTIAQVASYADTASPAESDERRLIPFALLPGEKNLVEEFLSHYVSRFHVKREDIEDAFPCSAMQEGILLSEAKSPDHYKIGAVWKVTSSDSTKQNENLVDINRLQAAWREAVRKHQILRTTIVEAGFDRANFVLVVLKTVSAPILIVESRTLEEFKALPETNTYCDDGLPYRISICRIDTGETYCKFVANHALVDGSSMQVLLRDLAIAYDGQLSQENPPLYRDYIAYTRKQSAKNGIDFWKSYMAGAEPCHFPTLNRRTTDQAELFVLNHHIKGEEAAAIRGFCKQHEVTLANVFNVIWALILRSYSRNDSVCFGYVTSGRDAPIFAVYDILGPLINMLVYRCIFRSDSTLLSLLKENHETYTQSLTHQHCGLKEISHLIGTGGETPFNTIVNVQRGIPASQGASDGVNGGIIFSDESQYDPTEYGISLDILDHDAGFQVMLSSWTSLLSRDHAAGILNAVLTGVNALLCNPHQSIRDVTLLSDKDELLISQWNSPYETEEACLHHRIERQAFLQPNELAIMSNDGDLTYHELDVLSEKLAHHLVTLGIGPEVIVPFCFEKSLWAVIAIVATLKAGGACVAVDPSQPVARMQQVFRDTRATVCLVSSSQKERVASHIPEAITVCSGFLDILPEATSKVASTAKPHNAAYVVYTSGSTGTPKGAILEHRNLFAMSRMLPQLNMSSKSRVAHFASYVYDVSIEETVLALTQGACICIISEEDRFGNLTQAMTRMQVSWAELTPTVVRTLNPGDLPHLETLILGGELLPDDVIKNWADRVDLINTYGPCECSITCSLTRSLKQGEQGTNIGKPFGSHFWIADPENHNTLAPVGAIGELFIEGPIVGRGYLNDDSKTREAFVTNPLWARRSSEAGSRRFYKTGDLARWNYDGTVEYMGRKDSQTKIHGQRIELEEIEHHIALHPLTARVVVSVPVIGKLQQKLVALIMPKGLAEDGDTPVQSHLALLERKTLEDPSMINQLTDIRSKLEKSLPRHMVPSFWILVKHIPLLPSGKTNRRLVRNWLENISQNIYAQVVQSLEKPNTERPLSDMELCLQNIWSEILDMPARRIGISQSLFNLGGDSMAVMQIVSRCRREGILLTARDIFVYKTIADLVPRCVLANHGQLRSTPEQPQCTADTATLPLHDMLANLNIEQNSIEDSCPCSPIQDTILIAQEKQRRVWYASWTCEILSTQHGQTVNMDTVASSWQRVVDRHQILRTIFTRSLSDSGRHHQIVFKRYPAVILRKHCDSSDTSAMFDSLPEILDAQVPPHMLILSETSSGRVFCQLQISHTLYDAVSLSLLWNDLQLAYSQALPETPAPQYLSFSSYLENRGRTEAISHWSSILSNLSSCHFPSMREQPLSGDPSFETFIVPLRNVNKLSAFANEHGVTIANIFQAVWAHVLKKFTGKDNPCFGLMLSKRAAPIDQADTTMGPLINLLPCHVELSRFQTIKSLLNHLQTDLADTMMHHNCSLEDINRAIGSKEPLFNTFLNILPAIPKISADQSTIHFEEVDRYMIDEYAISVYVEASPDNLSVSFKYWTSVISMDQAHLVSDAINDALCLILGSA